jgi:multidrug resistance protein, MATE family
MIFLAGSYGKVEMTAMTIALSINMIAFMPMIGISEATGVVVGRHIGGGNHQFVGKTTHKAWVMATIYMFAVSIIYIFIPEQLYSIFSPKSESCVDFVKVVAVGKGILGVVILHNICNAVRFIVLGALRGAGDTRVPMWIVAGSSWLIMVPGTYLVVKVLKLGIIDLWIFMVCFSLTVAILVYLRFKSGVWKNIDMIGGKRIIEENAAIEVIESESPIQP